MNSFPLVTRSWNGTPIGRRTTDGYVNATAMCKANGKRWKDYRESDRCQLYLDALESVAGISVHGLVESRSGGAGGGGTWVHPQVAVDLARWISPAFAVWMDGWFLEELAAGRVSQVQDTQPAEQAPKALQPQETLDLIERSYGLLERFGVVDDRDRIQFGDMVRNVTARGAGGLLLSAGPDNDEMTISDAWLEVMGEPLERGKAPAVGKLVAAMYREEFKEEPPTRVQWVDGAPRQVKSYVRRWLIKALSVIQDNIAA